MSVRAGQFTAQVRERVDLTPHLTRIVLGGDGLSGFASTGVPDEWVGLIVPGQFQSRYYTVRSWTGDALTLDVVVHDEGLVTEWVRQDCVGQSVTITEPKGSFAMPDDATWLHLVGDLTALPAMARIAEETKPGVATRVWAEVPERSPGYFGAFEEAGGVTWLEPPGDGGGDGGSALAAYVETMPWPESPGYFWMAGESSQMRAIRKHLMREVRLPSARYDVMGYWRGGAKRRPRAVDPGPIWRAGKAAGKTDDEIWADYDRARDGADSGPAGVPGRDDT